MGKVAMSSLYITLTLKIKFKLKKCLHLMKIEVDGTKLLLGPLQMGHSRNSKKSSSFRPRSLHLLEQDPVSCWYNIKTMKLKLSPNQKPAIYYFECENQQTIFQ